MGMDEGKNLASSTVMLYPVQENLPKVKPFLSHAEAGWMRAQVLQFCHSPHFRNDLYRTDFKDNAMHGFYLEFPCRHPCNARIVPKGHRPSFTDTQARIVERVS
jgi:hypothetical protein